jgi:hypothetical protein
MTALRMVKHPEGGYYRETFRSADEIQVAGLPARYGASRSASTAIYFLLEGNEISALHRIQSDEVWHFYAGSALTLHVIAPGGHARTCVLGPDVDRGDAFQAVVPARHWFGATVNDTSSFALVGCTVAPGFCFEDIELGDRGALVAKYPQHRALIERLTRPAS